MSARLRHRFEPARMVLGLPLIVVGVGSVLRVCGVDPVSEQVLLAIAPAALCAAGITYLTTRLVRDLRAERRTEKTTDSEKEPAG